MEVSVEGGDLMLSLAEFGTTQAIANSLVWILGPILHARYILKKYDLGIK